ncbi:unnamed protein product (macronuclear) [Paramecium tetraurelia]|uniref:Uncharacterized protein n=1 Tax=Paramecium tetraurelia TaxID=5888 RepID=A0EGM7_PARTE|nr:uncharacterized protein GSPATT00026792001 [Paramecium tetraurelia]CAK94468.1 unnamed protein product [Paramecium tetraurelia]|eukprot:XP_001461841.1 hypothetical protein (macronuclear) [Paramecium tetraurelia strain d4-2]
MQNHRFILNEYMNLILNKRVSVNQDVNNQHILNQTLNSKSNEVSLCISIYLEHTLSHRKILAEQWILQFKSENNRNLPCANQCTFEKKSLCCMFTKSSLYQNFLNKQECYQNYLLQIVIEHNGKNQNLELYKCYHLNMEQDVSIIARFHQHLNLTQEVGKPRSLSFQEQTMIPKQNNRLRFNSEQVRTPERKVLMYSVDEEVTFLIDEDQIERVMSHNSDSDYMIQTIEEETDVSEWQVIDHKHLLTRDQKKLLNSLQEMRNLFNSKSKHSHQIKQALELFF